MEEMLVMIFIMFFECYMCFSFVSFSIFPCYTSMNFMIFEWFLLFFILSFSSFCPFRDRVDTFSECYYFRITMCLKYIYIHMSKIDKSFTIKTFSFLRNFFRSSLFLLKQWVMSKQSLAPNCSPCTHPQEC